jgi:hypothetical protein
MINSAAGTLGTAEAFGSIILKTGFGRKGHDSLNRMGEIRGS